MCVVGGMCVCCGREVCVCVCVLWEGRVCVCVCVCMHYIDSSPFLNLAVSSESKLWMVGRLAEDWSTVISSFTESSTFLERAFSEFVPASQRCRASERKWSGVHVSVIGRLSSSVELIHSRWAWMRHWYKSSTCNTSQGTPSMRVTACKCSMCTHVHTCFTNLSNSAMAPLDLLRKVSTLSEVQVTWRAPEPIALSTCTASQLHTHTQTHTHTHTHHSERTFLR